MSGLISSGRDLFIVFWVICFSVSCLAQTYLGGLSIHYVGEYGGVPWVKPGTVIRAGSRTDRVKDLNLAISSINLSDNMSKKFLSHWSQVARIGKEQGKIFLPRVYFWVGNDRFKGKVKSIDYYWRRMDKFLTAMELGNFYGVCLAEENVVSRATVLAELYRRIKAKYGIRVYQWWSPANTVPEYRIPADGWIVDIYSYGGKRFRKYVQRYLLTGKPLIIMPYASWVEGEPEWADRQWKILFDQLQVAREYNLPVAFYWTYGHKGRGSGVSFGMCENNFMGKINKVIFDWIKEARSYPENYNGLVSADYGEGDVLEIGPTDEKGNFVYTDSFDTSRFILDADISGFRNILWEKARRLAVRSWNRKVNPRVLLLYHFKGDFKLKNPSISLNVPFLINGSRIAIAVSVDGKRWEHNLSRVNNSGILKINTSRDKKYSAIKEFFVRIEVKGSKSNKICARIDDFKVQGKLSVSSKPVIMLRPIRNNPRILVFEDDFQTRRYLCEAEIFDGAKLEWRRGQIAVRLRPGGTKAELIWHVKTNKPVRNIIVDVTGLANNGSLGTNHYIAISVDDRNCVHKVDTTKMRHNKSGWAYHGLKIDTKGDKRFSGIREFYVKLSMIAHGYKKVHRYQSGIVKKIRIRAEIVE